MRALRSAPLRGNRLIIYDTPGTGLKHVVFSNVQHEVTLLMGNAVGYDVAEDLTAALRRWPLWTALAWEELRERYRRTIFGVFWAFVSYGLFCFVYIVVFGAIRGGDVAAFTTYIVVGYLAWQFIFNVITDGCTVFISARSWIKGMRLPFLVFVFQSITRIGILTAFGALAGIIIIAVFGKAPDSLAWLSIAGIFPYVLAAIPAQLILGIACAMVRDFEQIMGTVMRAAFFLTPIIWEPSQLGERGRIAVYNPLTHFIEIIRAPMVHGEVPVTSWIVVAATCVMLWLIAVLMLKQFARRIAYRL